MFNHTSSGALLQSRLHKLTAIRHTTRPSDETVPRTHTAAVGVQHTAHLAAQPVRGFLGAMQSFHQNDSFSNLVTTWGLTAMSGCTPIMRKVCCTVWLNTGAATSPP